MLGDANYTTAPRKSRHMYSTKTHKLTSPDLKKFLRWQEYAIKDRKSADAADVLFLDNP